MTLSGTLALSNIQEGSNGGIEGQKRHDIGKNSKIADITLNC